MILGFTVVRRNLGHWDIGDSEGRLFRVRGGPGKYCVIDERPDDVRKDILDFKTVSSCMSYICDELMFELVAAESQEVTRIEDYATTTTYLRSLVL